MKRGIHKSHNKPKKHKELINSIKNHIAKKTKIDSKKVPSPVIKKPKSNILPNLLIILAILILAGYIIFFSNIIKRDCGNDLNCFNQAAARCSGAKLEAVKETNTYAYSILGPIKSDCIIDVQLKSMPPGAPIEAASKMEGKSMRCTIPKELLKANSINNIENLIGYCSGPLKESLYEVLIDKMYTLIIKNMANITQSVEKELQGYSK